MKKLFNVAALFAIVLFAVACNKDTSTPTVVTVTDYALADGVEFKDIVMDELYVFRSQEQLYAYLEGPSELLPQIDYTKYSLILTTGANSTGIVSIDRTLTRNADGDYRFKVSIESNAATVVQKWAVLVLAPAIASDAEVTREVVQVN